MRFKVNGADIWARGANQIPMEEMEGRELREAYLAMLDHARSAGHNMLRVWGGGKFLPQVFYDACDSLGIMIFHDVMYGTPWFGGNGSVPVATAMQVDEIRYNIYRLASHPSIVVWNGGNEFNTKMFAAILSSFVCPTIARYDISFS